LPNIVLIFAQYLYL